MHNAELVPAAFVINVGISRFPNFSQRQLDSFHVSCPFLEYAKLGVSWGATTGERPQNGNSERPLPVAVAFLEDSQCLLAYAQMADTVQGLCLLPETLACGVPQGLSVVISIRKSERKIDR